jgi:hypothetical protein
MTRIKQIVALINGVVGRILGCTNSQLEREPKVLTDQTEITHGDLRFAFDNDFQSPDIEILREQYLESVKLRLASQSRFYDRVFSEANYRAFHNGLSEAVVLARSKRAVDPGEEKAIGFMTGAGLSACVTWDEGLNQLHISFQQLIGPTTHAVCSLFGYFTLTMLEENDVQFTRPPFFTDSRIHHLILQFQPNHDLRLRDFDTVRSMQEAVFEVIRRDGKLMRDESPDRTLSLVEQYDRNGVAMLDFEYLHSEELSRQLKVHERLRPLPRAMGLCQQQGS